MDTEEMRIDPNESFTRLPVIDEAHKILDEADWPQGSLVDRIKRLARALCDFREVAADSSRSGLFRSLEKTSAALRREHAEKQELLERAEAETERWREIAEEESWPFEWEIATELRAEKAKLKEQVADLRGMLQEAVAREAVLAQALEDTWDDRESMAYRDDDVGWVFHLNGRTTNAVRDALRGRSTAAAALLERLADQRSALQAALEPLEQAADALVAEARVAKAADLIDDALVAIREELEAG